MSKSQEQIDLELATQFVIDNPRAREFVWWVLGQCGVYLAPHAVNGETGIHIGRRVIGVTIINQITSVDPTAYARMMIEAHNRAEAAASIKEQSNEDADAATDE